MSGSRGLVKLMDFGLAQLAGSSKFTREGTTLGTVNYMSPEQAEGAPTGPATDIWPLGVVLYEMVAGQKPFRGDFDQAIVYSIMNEPAEPLTAVRTGVPKELERIVNKCLAKKPAERYHHTDELLADLQGVRKELEPQASRVAMQPAAAKRTSPALIGAGAVVLLGVLGLGWWFGRSTDSRADDPHEYRLTQITQDTGFTGNPALSPDGKHLAYASDRSGEGNSDIWVQQLGRAAPIRLTTDPADDHSPSFSPDGNRIGFQSGRDGGGIYVVPALGGSPPRRLADGGNNPKFSPDGALVSYWQFTVDRENHRLFKAWVVPTSGGAARIVETNLARALPTAWSPDGRYLLAVGSIAPGEFGGGGEFDWWLVPVDGGEAVALGVRELYTAAGLVLGGRFPDPGTWLAEGSWVIFDAATRGGTRNLWRIRVSAAEKRVVGEPQKLTAGIGEQSASVSADGRIAFMNMSLNWDIWSLPIDANRAEVKGDPERIVSGLGTDQYPSVSADGRKLVYTSSRAGNDDVWLRDLEANKDTQVTVGPGGEFRGVISPDGTKVVFRRGEQGKSNVYLTELGRGSERLLLEDVGSNMDFTSDGKKILFYTNAPIRWKTLDIETGEQQDLGLEHSPDPIHSVRFSPDQKWVAFKLANENCPIFIARVVGGTAQDEDKWITVTDSSGPESGHNWWSPDGNTLYVLARRDEFACIWACSLDPVTKEPLGPLRAVQHFHGQLRFPGFGASRFGYGLTAERHYMALTEAKANIYLAEPQGALTQ